MPDRNEPEGSAKLKRFTDDPRGEGGVNLHKAMLKSPGFAQAVADAMRAKGRKPRYARPKA